MKKKKTLISETRKYLQLLQGQGKLVFQRNRGELKREYILTQGENKGKKRRYLYNYGKHGSSDFIIWCNGACVFLECKKKGNNPEPNDKEFTEKIRKQGAVYIVVNNFREVKRVLEIMEIRTHGHP